MIKQETLNTIIQYLVNRPYQEVIGISTMIQNDMQHQPNETAIEEEKSE